jgi:hypothetical protein
VNGEVGQHSVEEITFCVAVRGKRRELRAQHIGLEHRSRDAAVVQCGEELFRDGALAGARKAGQPDGEAHAPR